MTLAHEVKRCNADGCGRPPRIGIRSTRPHRAELKTTLWYDVQTAPATADAYCAEHAAALVSEAIQLFGGGDYD